MDFNRMIDYRESETRGTQKYRTLYGVTSSVETRGAQKYRTLYGVGDHQMGDSSSFRIKLFFDSI
jgi:hypothetical protein